MIRVVLADDQALIRRAIRSLLESAGDIEVVAEASDGTEAVVAAQRHRPDVVVMDVRMPHVNGIDATRRIRGAQPEVAVIVLTTFDMDRYVFQAVRAGAAGFFLKDGDVEPLLEGIRVAASGQAVMDPGALRRLLEEFARTAEPAPEVARALAGLTERELEVLRAMAEGMTNGEIADRLVVSPATVKTHVGSILAKLGVRDRTQAVVLAWRGGLAT
jgi:DNA-binding NarL/FixJ family response regulator